MKLRYIAGIICLSLLVISCASAPPRLQEVQIPPERIVQKGYSLIPLNEKGWLVGGRSQHQLALGKLGADPDESYVIQATLVKIEPYNTPEEFVRLIKDSQTKDTDPKRFKVIQNDVSAYPKKGTDCAKIHTVTEDNAAARKSGNTGVMILEVSALACAHPKDKTVVVYVGYSNRYYPGHRDGTFLEKSSSVLNSIEFTDL